MPLTLAEQAMDSALRFLDRDIARDSHARKSKLRKPPAKPQAAKNAT